MTKFLFSFFVAAAVLVMAPLAYSEEIGSFEENHGDGGGAGATKVVGCDHCVKDQNNSNWNEDPEMTRRMNALRYLREVEGREAPTSSDSTATKEEKSH